MFPREKHITLQAVEISPHQFIPCQIPEKDGSGKHVKAQQKQKISAVCGLRTLPNLD